MQSTNHILKTRMSVYVKSYVKKMRLWQFPKTRMSGSARMCSGIEFHAAGSACEKARSPNLVSRPKLSAVGQPTRPTHPSFSGLCKLVLLLINVFTWIAVNVPQFWDVFLSVKPGVRFCNFFLFLDSIHTLHNNVKTNKNQ